MQVRLPQTINSGHGEIVRFKECIHEPGGDRILFEGSVQPDCGPILHVHLQQAEGFEVKQGVMACQTPGSDVQYLHVGESTVFEKSVPHRFWNSSDEELILISWAKPAGNLQRYMTILFLSTSKRSSNTPGLFDASYLAMQYREEFDVLEVPHAMKQFVFPVVYWIGQLLGLYKKYEADSLGK
jgi:mannose-6-phosphate isomerase-like protein (cupin superfamily)